LVARIEAEAGRVDRAHRAQCAGRTTMFNVITGLQKPNTGASSRGWMSPQGKRYGRRAPGPHSSSVRTSSGLSVRETSWWARARRHHTESTGPETTVADRTVGPGGLTAEPNDGRRLPTGTRSAVEMARALLYPKCSAR